MPDAVINIEFLDTKAAVFVLKKRVLFVESVGKYVKNKNIYIFQYDVSQVQRKFGLLN